MDRNDVKLISSLIEKLKVNDKMNIKEEEEEPEERKEAMDSYVKIGKLEVAS